MSVGVSIFNKFNWEFELLAFKEFIIITPAE